MNAGEVARVLVGVALGALGGLALANVAFASRLTRLETQMDEVLRFVRKDVS